MLDTKEHLARERKFREKNNLKNYRLIKNLPIEIYAHLLNKAACIVGNSFQL